MNKYITEVVGTFFLCLTVALTAGQTDMAPIAIGVSLMCMVYMGGHVSGAHYNPAVTFAMMIRKKIENSEGAIYMVSQIAGAALAGVTANYLMGASYGSPVPTANFGQSFLVEFLFTFALVLVVFNVAATPATDGNSFYGLAIGLTVLFAAFAGGGISGGAYNPAVGIGLNAIKGDFSNIMLYILGPCAGGLAAAFFHKFQLCDNGCCDKAAEESEEA